MRAEVEIARQWVAKARNDLLDADNNLSSADVPTDMVCFHCQQAAEKILKAAMAARGVAPPRTHVLMSLAEQLTSFFPSLGELGDVLAVLTPYAVSARYPDDDCEMPSMEDAREARECVERVFAWLRRACPELAQDDGVAGKRREENPSSSVD